MIGWNRVVGVWSLRRIDGVQTSLGLGVVIKVYNRCRRVSSHGWGGEGAQRVGALSSHGVDDGGCSGRSLAEGDGIRASNRELGRGVGFRVHAPGRAPLFRTRARIGNERHRARKERKADTAEGVKR